MQKLTTVVVLAAFISICSAYGGQNFYFPAAPLTCYVQNPLYGLPGQEPSKPEDTPVIPFQPAPPGQVYLPLNSSFTPPILGPFPAYVREILVNFIGSELNNQLTSIPEEMPRSTPAIAGTIIPLRIRTSGDGVGPGVDRMIDYEPDVREIFAGLVPQPDDPDATLDAVIRVVNQLTGRCRVMARWTRLPKGYFPPWYSASFCSGEGCSLPSGLICEPVLNETSILHITVLRWDCCWSLRNLQWRWECGYRRVRIPIIGLCHCGCGPLYAGRGPPYVARIPGNFRFSVPNLNT